MRKCTSDNRGTDFWLTFTSNGSSQNPISFQFHITSDTATTGTVSIPSIPYNARFSASPGAITTAIIPLQAMLASSDVVESKGIHITSAATVTVYGMDLSGFSTDGYLGLPTSGAGTQYIVLSYKNVNVRRANLSSPEPKI